MPESIEELDLSPLPAKSYKSFSRPWDQEILYFLLIDRFHDNFPRQPVNRSESRSGGFGNAHSLQKTCGGTLTGIRKNMDYIKNLGCTAIWISPFLHNNPEAYHGYAVQNFLDVDPRFGSLRDLQDLVNEAHDREMRVIFDVVINHSGNNWTYNGGMKAYTKGKIFPFGQWRFENFPLPVELRDQKYYRKQGMIRNWDEYPETREGDFYELKKFRLDETPEGKKVQDILYRIFAWWIRETGCDGFRLDTMKHMHPLQVARFCTRIRNYAGSLGKEDFFIFGEHPGGDDEVNEYFQLFPEREGMLEGPDSALDFPLHYILSSIAEGDAPLNKLSRRYQKLFRNGPAIKSQRVTFLDNHDQVAQTEKGRFAASLDDEQAIAGLGLLLTLPGIPCIYYGTEQGFVGKGPSDAYIREAMFDPDGIKNNILNQRCRIYKEISRLALIRKQHAGLTSQEIKFLRVSENGRKSQNILAYSRGSRSDQLIILFNRAKNQTDDVSVQLTDIFPSDNNKLKYLYGGNGQLDLNRMSGREKNLFFKIKLLPFQFAILKLAPNLGNI